ncbi:hypothetical protein MN086_06515 [Sulfurovum sp. XGS-02]|uniref:hypothetical protein n=1 Tax=Sulfurovum sp. XGS-02 TaxID=2925411 RepID=UPI002052F009|nr:hypothetical protein [Sulfurovum sp. XGS-02]UPT76704.1 hypothetical protein MN086_06515 [Sulfurovum sp. XGS-02]
MTNRMDDAEIDYIKQEKDKILYKELGEKLEEMDREHDVALWALKEANDVLDSIWERRQKLKKELRNVSRRLRERTMSRTLYMIDFRLEMELYSPKIIFENTHIISAIFSDGAVKIERSLQARVKDELTWNEIFSYIDPMEIYVILRTIILKRFYKDTAYTIGGNMDEEKVKNIEKKAFEKMRTISFIENIYK